MQVAEACLCVYIHPSGQSLTPTAAPGSQLTNRKQQLVTTNLSSNDQMSKEKKKKDSWRFVKVVVVVVVQRRETSGHLHKYLIDLLTPCCVTVGRGSYRNFLSPVIDIPQTYPRHQTRQSALILCCTTQGNMEPYKSIL